MTRTLFVLAAVVLAAAPHAQAQGGVIDVGPGQRVRIHEGQRKVVGTLLSVDSATMRILTSHTDTALVARADVTRLDVSVGQKSRAGSGALIGAGVGAAGGALAMVVVAGPEELESNDISAAVYVGGAAVIGMALGAVVGAVVGANSHTDRWERSVWPTLGASLGSAAGKGVAMGLRITF